MSIMSISLTSLAQPTIQASELNPVAGETFESKICDWVPEGNWGNNVTWDLSGLVETPTTNDLIISGANTGFAGTNTTLADQAGNAYYQDNSSTGQFVHGFLGGTVLITYSDPMQIMSFPLDNAVYDSDTHAATFVSGGYPFTRTGTTLVFADSWGTLITPEGTFTDVIRVRLDQDYTDVYSLGTIDYEVQVYAWYKAGIHTALATVVTLATTMNYSQYATYLVTNGLGIEENSTSGYHCLQTPLLTY